MPADSQTQVGFTAYFNCIKASQSSAPAERKYFQKKENLALTGLGRLPAAVEILNAIHLYAARRQRKLRPMPAKLTLGLSEGDIL
jgi:hypothetical protein